MIVIGPIWATGLLWTSWRSSFRRSTTTPNYTTGRSLRPRSDPGPPCTGCSADSSDSKMPGGSPASGKTSSPARTSSAASNGSTPTGITAARDLLAAHRPWALHHKPAHHRAQPELGLAFVGWLRTLLPGGAR